MTPIQCPKCHRQIGHKVRVGDFELVQIGEVVLREFHGVCAVCAADLHFSIADRQIKMLILQSQVSQQVVKLAISGGTL